MITNFFRSARLTTLKSSHSYSSESASRFAVACDDGVGAGHCDGRVAASNAPRKCPGGKGWIGGGAQASLSSYRRFDARAEGEKRISLSVVVEVPVGVERECEYKRVFIAVCFRECISSASLRTKKIYKTLRRHHIEK